MDEGEKERKEAAKERRRVGVQVRDCSEWKREVCSFVCLECVVYVALAHPLHYEKLSDENGLVVLIEMSIIIVNASFPFRHSHFIRAV